MSTSVRLFRAMWFLSTLIVLADLLYVYASLQEEVMIPGEGAEQYQINRETLFYALLVLIGLINGMVFLVGKVYPAKNALRGWFYGQVITVNIFFVIALSLISVINSHEVFDYSRIGFLVYGSVALIILWALSWPVLKIFGGKEFK